jgi:hypothetical protein
MYVNIDDDEEQLEKIDMLLVKYTNHKVHKAFHESENPAKDTI